MKINGNVFKTGQGFGRVFKRPFKGTSWFLKMLLVRADRKVRKCYWEEMLYSDLKFGDTYGNMEDRKYTQLPEFLRRFSGRELKVLSDCSY